MNIFRVFISPTEEREADSFKDQTSNRLEVPLEEGIFSGVFLDPPRPSLCLSLTFLPKKIFHICVSFLENVKAGRAEPSEDFGGTQ